MISENQLNFYRELHSTVSQKVFELQTLSVYPEIELERIDDADIDRILAENSRFASETIKASVERIKEGTQIFQHELQNSVIPIYSQPLPKGAADTYERIRARIGLADLYYNVKLEFDALTRIIQSEMDPSLFTTLKGYLMPPNTTRCMFCGNQDRLTKEHILKESWRNHFGASRFHNQDWGWFLDSNGTRTPINRQFWNIAFSRTLKEVCAKCNNGWMNQLEKDAEQLLLSILKGEYRELSTSDLDIIIRWSAKTSFVAEAADLKRRAGHQSQFSALISNRAPAEYFLWIYPIEPNGIVKFRCSELSFPERGATKPDPLAPRMNIVSVHFFESHFLSVITKDVPPEIFERALALTNILGHPVQERADGWSWPPAQPAPAIAPDAMHTTLIQYVNDRWNWLIDS